MIASCYPYHYPKALRVMYLLLLFAILLPSFTLSQSTISGVITLESGQPVPDIPVYISGGESDTIYTDQNGYYEVTMIDGLDYSINLGTPLWDFPLYGIDTFDLMALHAHMLELDLLDSPYKIIACDVNLSGSVTTLDLVLLAKLLEGIILEFPFGSWRYVDADFLFPNPQNPWQTTFPDVININDLNQDLTDQDFIAVKLGDVNNSIELANITGKLFFDDNANCSYEPAETTLPNLLVLATNGVDSFYSMTNSSGEFNIGVIPGTYGVSLLPSNNLWSTCQASYTASVAQFEIVDLGLLPLQPLVECARMGVDISAPLNLRICESRQYAVQYCNQGTITATDALVEVDVNPNLIVTSSIPPWSGQNGTLYSYEVGDVNVGQCGTIVIHFDVTCDDNLLGSTFCSDAHAYPDTICPPPNALWDGANLQLATWCESDSVFFDIHNTGAEMTESTDFLVIEDDMIMLSSPIDLGADEHMQLAFEGDGFTWRGEMEQAPYHPFNERVSVSIEACGLNNSGEFSTGFVTMFPSYTYSNAEDIVCQELVGSFDPNDKNALPKGVGPEHYIEANTELEYLIRFQNTGTDTAFSVVIKDTLSAFLDIESFRAGAASHLYEVDIWEDDILVFTFSNIALPDSNVNEPASHGFVSFRINQHTNNPIGAIIENRASIYFDYNEAVVTNTIFHTIGEDFLDEVTNLEAAPKPGQHAAIRIYPNPVNDSSTILLGDVQLLNGTLELYDLQGRRLVRKIIVGNSCKLMKGDCSGGVYLYRVLENGILLGSGKIVIE